MKKITLEKIIHVLRTGEHAVKADLATEKAAEQTLTRMLEYVKK